MSARGEETIVLTDETEVKILFTNRALAQVEERLNEPIMITATNLSNGIVSMAKMAQLLKCGIEAAKKDAGENPRVTLQDAYDVLDDVGFLKVLQVVVRALTGCLNYGSSE